MKFDVEYINPLGNPGTHYAVEAFSIEEAEQISPEYLAASSQWRPEQFKIISAKISIYEENK